VEHWQQCGIWSQIVRTKQIFVEPRTKDAFSTAMTEYYQQINDPASRGAIFMAVCRGKVSEGLDFADANGRAVIITGLPFPPLKDPRVLLKQKYLDENRSKNRDEILTGKDWYVLEATRAVNQAIGRVIRHKNDYGAILFCDSRFNYPQQKNQLSKWVLRQLKVTPAQSFGQVVGELARFFKNAERTLPQPKLKPLSYAERGEDEVATAVGGAPIKIKVEADDFNISSNYGNVVKTFGGQPIRKANEIMCFEPPEASRFIKKEPPASQDLFGRLDGDVAVSVNIY
jgi:regulator of telomere elongation helicase 1